MRAIIFLILIVVIPFGCRAPKAVYSYKQPKTLEKTEGSFAILSCEIKVDSAGGVRLTLLEKHIVTGALKIKQDDSAARDKLIFQQEDDQGNVKGTFLIDHPLIRHVEYVNQKGEFETSLLELEHAEFFIRFEIDPQTSYIRVIEVRGERENQLSNLKIR